MADALRQLLAQFVVQVDPDGALKRGESQVDALAQSLRKLDGVFGKLNVGAFAKLNTFRNPFAGFGSAVNASSDGIRKGLGGFISGVTTLQNGLAALAGGVIGSQVKALIDDIGGIGEEASKLGVANDEFQRLKVLAEQNATSVGALGTAFRTVGKAAADPTNETAEAFRQLGVVTKQNDGTFRSRNDLFFDSAMALADVSDETERVTLAQQLFGRSAIELLPLLSQGSEGIRSQRAELEKLPVVTDAAIEAADRFSDHWPATMLRLKVVAGEALEKVVLPALEGLLALIDKLSAMVMKISKTFNFWTIALGGLVVALSPLLSQLGLLVALGGGVGAMLKSLVVGFAGVVKAVAPAIAAFLLLEDLFTFFAGGDSLIGRGLEKAFGPDFTKHMDELRDAAKGMWGWITGENVNLTGKTKALLDEIKRGLELLVNDALSLIPFSGRKAGLQGLEDYEAGKLQQPGTVQVPAASGPAQSFVFDPASGGYRNVTVTINNPPPGEGQAMAQQVRNVLDRDRNADLANVQ